MRTSQRASATNRRTSTKKSPRSAAKKVERAGRAVANTCEEQSSVPAASADCGCGPSLMRVWASRSMCCDDPRVIPRATWTGDCCCSC
ncbi:MAG: hypothetical protein HY905_10610 [Deltaproteobacteria bacterium]|nr:hypothetical protein [Deltaproteobacteria bacterium]